MFTLFSILHLIALFSSMAAYGRTGDSQVNDLQSCLPKRDILEMFIFDLIFFFWTVGLNTSKQ